MSSAVSIMEVAKAAGVSKTTVSRVINGKLAEFRIGLTTQARVRSIASQMGYQPDPVARNVALGKGAPPRAPRPPISASPISASPIPLPSSPAPTAVVGRRQMGIVLAVDSASTTLALLPELEPVLAAADYRLVMITVPADPAVASQRVNQLIQEGIVGLLCCPTIYQATVATAAGRCPVIVLWAGAAKAMLATLNDPMASQTPAPAPTTAAAPAAMMPPPSPVAAAPATKPTPIAPPPVATIPPVIILVQTLQPEPEPEVAPAPDPEPFIAPPVVVVPESSPITSPEPAPSIPPTTEQPDNSATITPPSPPPEPEPEVAPTPDPEPFIAPMVVVAPEPPPVITIPAPEAAPIDEDKLLYQLRIAEAPAAVTRKEFDDFLAEWELRRTVDAVDSWIINHSETVERSYQDVYGELFDATIKARQTLLTRAVEVIDEGRMNPELNKAETLLAALECLTFELGALDSTNKRLGEVQFEQVFKAMTCQIGMTFSQVYKDIREKEKAFIFRLVRDWLQDVRQSNFFSVKVSA